MTCGRVSRWIPLAVGRDLPVADQRVFDLHLQSCLRCYREHQRFQAELDALDPLRVPASAQAPDGLFDEILHAVRAGGPGPAAEPLPRRPSLSRVDIAIGARRGLPVAAGFLLCVFAGYQLLGGNVSQIVAPAGSSTGVPGGAIAGRTARPLDVLGMPFESHMRTVGSPGIGAARIVPASSRVQDGDDPYTGLPRARPVPPARVNRSSSGDF